MEIPFKTGVVTGRDLIDREAEMGRLVRDLGSSEKVFLIAPRRYGKTSLVINALERLKRSGSVPIYLDLYRASTFKAFIEIFTREVAAALETKVERAIEMIEALLPRVRPVVRFDPEGTISWTVDMVCREEELALVFADLLESLQGLAKKRNKKVIIAIDEFQNIRRYDGISIEQTMRSIIQHQDRVAYLFSGSATSIMRDMVEQEASTFYRLGNILYLGKIDPPYFVRFILRKFKGGGFSIDRSTAERIVSTVDNIPFYVQHLCRELWKDQYESRKIDVGSIDRTLDLILEAFGPQFANIFDTVLTLPQRRALQVLARRGGRGLFSREILKAFDLGSTASLSANLKALCERGYIEKTEAEYAFQDIYMKYWIRKNLGLPLRTLSTD